MTNDAGWASELPALVAGPTERRHDRRRAGTLGGVLRSLSSPVTRYRVMAYVTGVVLILLVCVAMPLKYWGDDERLVAIVGTAHGWLYLFYVLAAANLAYVRRWSIGRTLVVIIAGTIPFAVFFVERRVTEDAGQDSQPVPEAP